MLNSRTLTRWYPATIPAPTAVWPESNTHDADDPLLARGTLLPNHAGWPEPRELLAAASSRQSSAVHSVRLCIMASFYVSPRAVESLRSLGHDIVRVSDTLTSTAADQ